MAQAKRVAQLWQFAKDPSCPTPTRRGKAPPGQRITGMPQPARVRCALHRTPPLLALCRLDAAALSRTRSGAPPGHAPVVHWGERPGLFFNAPITVAGLTCTTRALSRTPLSVISPIGRFPCGVRPGYAEARINVRPPISDGCQRSRSFPLRALPYFTPASL
jgi:hypothetical protein